MPSSPVWSSTLTTVEGVDHGAVRTRTPTPHLSRRSGPARRRGARPTTSNPYPRTVDSTSLQLSLSQSRSPSLGPLVLRR